VLNPWTGELGRVVFIAALLLVVGLAADRVALVLLIGSAGYLAWHVYHLYRLERWLRRGSGGTEPPQGTGIWGEVYHHFYTLQRRSRERERKLASMLDRFQEAAAAMPDATVVTKSTGEIEWFNSAAERLLGLHSPEDIGQQILNLVRRPAFATYLRQGNFSEPLELPSPENESVMLQVRVVPYGRDQRLLVARDVTRLHRLEQMRRDFVANVSHELRTPLTVIAGFLETMRDAEDATLDEQWGSSLELMQNQATRMQRIVEDLLLLSRLEMDTAPEARDPVSVPSMLAAIREEAIRLSGDKGHAITLEADDRLWVLGNEQSLRSAFSNLVFNAVRYTPAGGNIGIRWYADRSGACLDVSDNGIGIPARHIPRLTERFYRVDVSRSRESGGTGLGLAIVKHVLNRHNARLEIESKPGEGSTFRCYFAGKAVFRHEPAA
jgi:two-component system phosphate regulon sensor histidine kinase PhoR